MRSLQQVPYQKQVGWQELPDDRLVRRILLRFFRNSEQAAARPASRQPAKAPAAVVCEGVGASGRVGREARSTTSIRPVWTMRRISPGAVSRMVLAMRMAVSGSSCVTERERTSVLPRAGGGEHLPQLRRAAIELLGCRFQHPVTFQKHQTGVYQLLGGGERGGSGPGICGFTSGNGDIEGSGCSVLRGQAESAQAKAQESAQAGGEQDPVEPAK